MQFGRFHGFTLLALGALLLLVQTYVIFEGRASSQRPLPEQTSETESKPPVNQPRALDYLPGIVGIVVVGLGAAALVQYQRKIIESADAREKIAHEILQHHSGRP